MANQESSLKEMMGEVDRLRERLHAFYQQTRYEDLEHATLALEIVDHALEEVAEHTGLGGHIEPTQDPDAHRRAEGWLASVRNMQADARSFLSTHPVSRRRRSIAGPATGVVPSGAPIHHLRRTMDTLQSYLIEEAVEEYKLGYASYDMLAQRLQQMTDDPSVLASVQRVVVTAPARAQVAGTNPNLAPGRATEGSRLTIPAEGIDLVAYLARPRDVERAPGIVVIHENRGLVKYLEDVADGLASHGYVAVAPDLLSREGGTSQFTNPGEEVPPLLAKIPPERHIGDLQAVVRYLQGRPDVTRLGVIGFCFGGGLTWRLVTENQDIAAAAPFYGPNPPLDKVPNIRAAVYAVYGGLDERINQGIPAIREALERAGVTHKISVYPNSQHAFHNHTNAERHNPETAQQAWQDALGWFEQYLKGPR
jgi:carboxymethylenebutenolidase